VRLSQRSVYRFLGSRSLGYTQSIRRTARDFLKANTLPELKGRAGEDFDAALSYARIRLVDLNSFETCFYSMIDGIVAAARCVRASHRAPHLALLEHVHQAGQKYGVGVLHFRFNFEAVDVLSLTNQGTFCWNHGPLRLSVHALRIELAAFKAVVIEKGEPVVYTGSDLESEEETTSAESSHMGRSSQENEVDDLSEDSITCLW
jgi:hypothetical protein